MNVLLCITMPFGGYMKRVVVRNIAEVSDAIEGADFRGRIRLKTESTENARAVRRLARIMGGDLKPFRSFMAGNNYFGRVRFEYERPDLEQEVPKSYILSVQVFSALGSTLAEHDERYRRNKDLKMAAVMREYL